MELTLKVMEVLNMDMQLSDNISCFSRPQKPNIFGIPNSNTQRKTTSPVTTKAIMPKAKAVTDPNFKMAYPGEEAYHFPSGTPSLSPCMSSFWRAQEIRQGIMREEIDRDEKPEEEE
jgi:hypothetical protein